MDTTGCKAMRNPITNALEKIRVYGTEIGHRVPQCIDELLCPVSVNRFPCGKWFQTAGSWKGRKKQRCWFSCCQESITDALLLLWQTDAASGVFWKLRRKLT